MPRWDFFSPFKKIRLLLRQPQAPPPAASPDPLHNRYRYKRKFFFIHFMLCCLNLFSASLLLFAFCRLSTWLPTGSQMLIFFSSLLSEIFHCAWLVVSSMTRPRWGHHQWSCCSLPLQSLRLSQASYPQISFQMQINSSLTHTGFLLNLNRRAARNPRR